MIFALKLTGALLVLGAVAYAVVYIGSFIAMRAIYG